MEITVVFPAHNEAKKIQSTVEKTISALKTATDAFEIIIAEDGSTDGTDKLASILSEKHPFVKHLHSDNRLGRGRALNIAFKQSGGDILVYMDVDLATNLEHLHELVGYIREGYEMATGSRMLKESRATRSFSRRTASGFFNFLVRFLLGSKIKDHQCGFKAFKRETLMQIIDEVKATHWFWDTEVIVRYQLGGYAVKEFPVEWKESSRTKVKLIKDSYTMGSQTLRLWWNLKIREN